MLRSKSSRPPASPPSLKRHGLRERRRFALGGWLVGLVMLGAVGVGVDGAAAARPARGALYADSDGPALLYLRVSPSGPWLNPGRSAIYWDTGGDYRDCGRPLRLRIGSARRPVRIKRGGRFRFVRRQGRFAFRLRGRFVTRERAKVRFRYRREPARPGRPKACDDASDRLRPRRIVPLRFRDCGTHKAKTLLRASTGRVFRELRWVSGGPSLESAWRRVAYGCLYSTNRLVKLGVDDGDPISRRDYRLVGPYVAFLRIEACGTGGCYTVVVRDLRSGRRTRALPTGFVSDLELKGNGSVAWIERPLVSGEPPTVRAADTHGVRQLDSGNIAEGSLRLNDSTLTWLTGGVARSATLY
jgi:hypothetical protein